MKISRKGSWSGKGEGSLEQEIVRNRNYEVDNGKNVGGGI